MTLAPLGTYAFQRGAWHLDAAPHIVLKLKRVFPRVNRRAHGTIVLSDTLEVARDLEWFISRYPLLPADDASAVYLTQRANHHREETSLVDRLLAGVQAGRAFDLAIPPRDYQRVGAELTIASGGLLLADDVGVGKTCTAICVISHEGARPALVVTLTHLPRQWEREIRKFAPTLTTHVLKSATPYDLRVSAGGRQRVLDEVAALPDVIIGNYHKLSGWAETLAPLVRTVVFDEGQELRHHRSQKSAAAAHIAGSATYRIALTATPIYNYGDEIFNVIEAVRPGALGTREEFLEEWCSTPDMRGRSRIANPAAFGTYARNAGLMLRRTRADVGRELPALQKIPHEVDCDEAALLAVESAATELANILLRKAESRRGERMQAAEELSNIVRQATGIAKAPYVAEFVKILAANGERVVLYGWHRAVYSLWLERLADLNPVMYTGSESPTQKQKAFEAFHRGDSQVLVMSLRAGAGVDGLQEVARTVVFGELDWSPGVHEQCIGRVYRDGQADGVVAYFLIANSGSDPIVADVLGVKSAQSAALRDPQAPLVEQLQLDGDHIKRLAEAYLNRSAA